MNEQVYTINELKQLISESAKDFKPRLGTGVESSNKKENNDAYSTAKKRVNDFDGGGKEMKPSTNAPEKEDGNKGMLDYELDAPISTETKDRIKAQAEGYTSTSEKNNGISKSGEFSDKSYKREMKAGKEMMDNKVTAKKSGLTARELPDSAFKKETLYKESKKIAVLNFKNTTFINESQMISRIPDDYKVDGNRFKVKDAGENEFIVEWKEGEASILSYENKKKLNESIEKFHKLSGYKSKEQFKTSSAKSRLNENTEFDAILNKARELAEPKK